MPARNTILSALYWLSGSPPPGTGWDPIDPARGMLRPSPVVRPEWADPDYVEHTIRTFDRTGFHAGLNYYRVLQVTFDLTAAFKGATLQQPSLYIWGAQDGLCRFFHPDPPADDELRAFQPNLVGQVRLDGVGHWPQHEAAYEFNAALLLDRGARTDIINHWHQTALELALHDGLDAISSLIEAREQVRAEAACPKPIFLAVREGDLDAVRTLVEAGADIEERTLITGSPDDNYTPLGLAARDGRTDIVEWLLGAGADPSRLVGLMGGTPAHEAAYAGHAEVIRVLTRMALHAGAARLDIDAQGAYNGLTALHDAVWHGHLEATKALIDAGARRELLSHSGLTPRDMAALYGYDAIVRMLDAADVPPS